MRDRISLNMTPRSTMLKALEKSTSRIMRSAGKMVESTRTLDTECTIASQLAETPTPSCRGGRILDTCLNTRETHLDVKRWSTPPTAMGRRPPHFFLQGKREAPQRFGVMEGGACPAQSWLMNLVRLERA